MSENVTQVGTRVDRIRDWLARQQDSRIGRFSFLMFRRYLEASKNTGAATTAYFMLSILPTALAAIAVFGKAGGDVNALANRIITRMHLTGTTAQVVSETFGTTANNALAATLVVVFGFWFWGMGIGQLYRDLYERAWHVETAQSNDQVLFIVWYFVACGLLGVMFAATTFASSHRVLFIPVWLCVSMAFWLWTPRFLLHRKVPIRRLLPGAVVGAVVLGGTIGTAPLWMGPTLNQNAAAFGPFGVVLALIGLVLTVITTSLACAVFAPVWEEFRGTEHSEEAVGVEPA
jgi:membrane protein